MISPEQQKVFRKVLGNWPLRAVLKWMAEQNPPIESRFGAPYSNAFISQVLSGDKENETIEKAIWGCVKEEIQRQVKEKAEKNEILDNAIELTDEEPS